MTVHDVTPIGHQTVDDENSDALRRGTIGRVELDKVYRHALGHDLPARVRARLVRPPGAEPYVLAHVLPVADTNPATSSV